MQPKASLSSAGELEPKNKEIKSDSIPEIVEKQFTEEEAKDICDQATDPIETVEGYTPKDNPIKSILKKIEKRSKFKADQSQAQVAKKEVKNVKFSSKSDNQDTDDEEASSHTSSEDECEFDQLVEVINQSSYCKLNMFLLSVCDKNRLINFIEHRNKKIQNSDVDKLDIFTSRISNEFKKSVPGSIDEEFRMKLFSEIQRLISYLDFYYDSIPTFTSDEYKSLLALFSRFIIDNGMIDEASQNSKNSKELLAVLDDKDYNQLLFEAFNIY